MGCLRACYDQSMSRVENGKVLYSEALKALKDQYAARERELENKHREEIREIKAAHREEVDELRKESQNRIAKLQEENNIKLNQKDIQHQKEIESLRAMYNKRLLEAKKG